MRKSFLLLFFLLIPLFLQAQTLEFSAWVPYWRKTDGVAETLKNLEKFSTILPFSYEVKTDGTIWDPMRLSAEPWPRLLAIARERKIKIIPTIMWNDGLAIEKVLADKKARDAHVKQIVELVKKNNFDGIDIDYENKTADSFNDFSIFIGDLSKELRRDKKLLSCTIEPRLPPSSRFLEIPEKIDYANDYPQLNRFCDEVRIMAYDQSTADILLNRRKKIYGYYAPVADIDFVKKVVAYASHQIEPSKIVLGVPNYGYVYQVIDKRIYYDYKKISSLTHESFFALAHKTGSVPRRNSAGELSFIYFSVPEGEQAEQPHFAVLSDPVAISAKIKFAQSFGLRGISLFKVDGQGDIGFWSLLSNR